MGKTFDQATVSIDTSKPVLAGGPWMFDQNSTITIKTAAIAASGNAFQIQLKNYSLSRAIPSPPPASRGPSRRAGVMPPPPTIPSLPAFIQGSHFTIPAGAALAAVHASLQLNCI